MRAAGAAVRGPALRWRGLLAATAVLLGLSATPAGAELPSAASGLVRHGDRLLLIADDEFDLFDCAPGLARCARLHPAHASELPEEKSLRSDLKPDYEALVPWPAGCAGKRPRSVQVSLLALPSGSKKSRTTGACLVLDPLATTDPARAPAFALDAGATRTVDFARLYKSLRKLTRGLNIEGAVVLPASGGSLARLRLFHRGNGERRVPMTIDLDLARLQRALDEGIRLPKGSIAERSYELGKLDDPAMPGVSARYGFTDAALLSPSAGVPSAATRIIFLMAAEVTDDPVRDGEVLGSAIGIMSLAGDVLAVHPLPGRLKAEGLAVAAAGPGEFRAFVVTDADDRSRPTQLLEVVLPLP